MSKVISMVWSQRCPQEQAPSTPAAGPESSVWTASLPAARADRMPPLERKTDSRAPGSASSRRAR